MRKRIIIYIIILIILLGLYLFFTPQSLKTSSENSSDSSSLNTPEKTSDFKGPIGAPSIKGPTEQPPNR